MVRRLPLTMFSITLMQDFPESHKGAMIRNLRFANIRSRIFGARSKKYFTHHRKIGICDSDGNPPLVGGRSNEGVRAEGPTPALPTPLAWRPSGKRSLAIRFCLQWEEGISYFLTFFLCSIFNFDTNSNFRWGPMWTTSSLVALGQLCISDWIQRLRVHTNLIYNTFKYQTWHFLSILFYLALIVISPSLSPFADVSLLDLFIVCLNGYY